MNIRVKKDLNKKIGSRLKHYRKQADYTQSEVAEIIGLKDGKTYSQYETGYAAIPFDRFLILCDILNVTPNMLLGYPDKKRIYSFCKRHNIECEMLDNSDVKLIFPDKEVIVSGELVNAVLDRFDNSFLGNFDNYSAWKTLELSNFENTLLYALGERNAERQMIVSNLANRIPDTEWKDSSGKTIAKFIYGKEVDIESNSEKDGE